MTLTTTELYTVDGVDLNTLAYNIRTLSGRTGTPPVIGEDRQVVGRPGSSWQRKDYGPRQETLAMWVLGCDVDGEFPTTHSRRAEFNQNLDILKRLFGVRHRQLALEKSVEFPDGLRTYTALGEVVDVIDPETMAGGTRATFSVGMLLADPFWYLPEEEDTIDAAGATITNPGSAVAQKMQIVFEGPLTFPRLTNVDLGVEVRLGRSLTLGQSVTLDTDRFTAVDQGGVNSIAVVSQFGADWWMELAPGPNDMTLTNSNGGAVGAGSVTVTYSPPTI